ncbi:MAG: heme exporter protein CcmB [Deltaproteobacteria bacterium]|nr:heme exporter protein CcmB [Deltaproteobacteria bacterium]MBW2536365.1 heme exporter protein CcmB [Deltaproteobacteria bacterium]
MSSTKRRPPGFGRQTWLILRKELQVELSTGEILSTSGLFAVLVVVVASMAFHAGADTAGRVAPGVVWVAVAFASVLALSRSWQRERDGDAMAGLLVLPVSRGAIYLGKALGLWIFLTALEALVVPVTALLFDLSLADLGPGLAAICLGATPGIAAAATLFGAMTLRTSARDLVLASVLFPLLAPTLLAAVAATRELVGGAPLAELTDYFSLMGLFGVVFTAGGLGLFGTLIDP